MIQKGSKRRLCTNSTASKHVNQNAQATTNIARGKMFYGDYETPTVI
jgi:hypothetical protein